MKNILAIVLIIGALVFGYLGINKIDNSGGSVDVLGVEIKAEDTGSKQTGFVYLGLGVVCLIAGVMALRKK